MTHFPQKGIFGRTSRPNFTPVCGENISESSGCTPATGSPKSMFLVAFTPESISRLIAANPFGTATATLKRKIS
jgi:hypothetical protein